MGVCLATTGPHSHIDGASGTHTPTLALNPHTNHDLKHQWPHLGPPSNNTVENHFTNIEYKHIFER